MTGEPINGESGGIAIIDCGLVEGLDNVNVLPSSVPASQGVRSTVRLSIQLLRIDQHLFYDQGIQYPI